MRIDVDELQITTMNEIGKGGWSIYCVLLINANEEHMVNITLRKISEVTGYTVEHVRRIMNKLIENRVIVKNKINNKILSYRIMY